MGSGAGSQSSIYALPLTAFISFDSDYLLVCASISSSVKWEWSDIVGLKDMMQDLQSSEAPGGADDDHGDDGRGHTSCVG